MFWRPTRPEHERLLEAQDDVSRDDADVEPKADAARDALRRLVLRILLPLAAVFVLGRLQLPGSWLALTLLLAFHFFALTRLRRGLPGAREADDRALGFLRMVLLFWIAISLACTVLIAIGGFQQEDRVVLVVVWAILAFIWLSDIGLVRLVASRHRADGGLGSSH